MSSSREISLVQTTTCLGQSSPPTHIARRKINGRLQGVDRLEGSPEPDEESSEAEVGLVVDLVVGLMVVGLMVVV